MPRGLVRSGAIGRPAEPFYGRALVYLLPRREERFSKDDGSLNACLQDETHLHTPASRPIYRLWAPDPG